MLVALFTAVSGLMTHSAWGVLLNSVALGYLPFAYSKKRGCTLSADTAVKRAKG